jgi:hypothetical protein
MCGSYTSHPIGSYHSLEYSLEHGSYRGMYQGNESDPIASLPLSAAIPFEGRQGSNKDCSGLVDMFRSCHNADGMRLHMIRTGFAAASKPL